MLVLHREPGNKGRDTINITVAGQRIAQIKAMEIVDGEIVLGFTAPETIDISRAEVRIKPEDLIA